MGSELYIDSYTNGIIGPHVKMLGPIADGGRITFVTAPGCWGPMITPTLRGGHEVCTPVMVGNADFGDAVVLYIEKIEVKSKAVSSGVDEPVEGGLLVIPMCLSGVRGVGSLGLNRRLRGLGEKP